MIPVVGGALALCAIGYHYYRREYGRFSSGDLFGHGHDYDEGGCEPTIHNAARHCDRDAHRYDGFHTGARAVAVGLVFQRHRRRRQSGCSGDRRDEQRDRHIHLDRQR